MIAFIQNTIPNVSSIFFISSIFLRPIQISFNGTKVFLSLKTYPYINGQVQSLSFTTIWVSFLKAINSKARQYFLSFGVKRLKIVPWTLDLSYVELGTGKDLCKLRW